MVNKKEHGLVTCLGISVKPPNTKEIQEPDPLHPG
jgi:hypothetical protein